LVSDIEVENNLKLFENRKSQKIVLRSVLFATATKYLLLG